MMESVRHWWLTISMKVCQCLLVWERSEFSTQLLQATKFSGFQDLRSKKTGDAIPPPLLLTFLQLCSSQPFIFARHLEACPPPVIKLIIPGERLTRYGSQRITIGCKKPIIRTPAQITNSASLATKHLSQGGQNFWMQLRNYQILKETLFHNFSLGRQTIVGKYLRTPNAQSSMGAVSY